MSQEVSQIIGENIPVLTAHSTTLWVFMFLTKSHASFSCCMVPELKILTVKRRKDP